jgi:hypothetical protein
MFISLFSTPPDRVNLTSRFILALVTVSLLRATSKIALIDVSVLISAATHLSSVVDSAHAYRCWSPWHSYSLRLMMLIWRVLLLILQLTMSWLSIPWHIHRSILLPSPRIRVMNEPVSMLTHRNVLSVRIVSVLFSGPVILRLPIHVEIWCITLVSVDEQSLRFFSAGFHYILSSSYSQVLFSDVVVHWQIVF